MELRASTYCLAESGRRVSAKERWAEMASDVVGEFADLYRYRVEWGYRIALLDGPSISPDGKIARYRTIEASIRRQAGKQTLLDLSLGNMYCEAGSEPVVRLHVVHEPRYAQWARLAGQIPLAVHVRHVEEFVGHVMDSGWMLEEARLVPHCIDAPRIRHGRGECPLPLKGFGQVARYPARDVPAGMDVVVIATGTGSAHQATSSLEATFSRCFPGSRLRDAKVAISNRLSTSAINLFLLDDNEDLSMMHALRDGLRRAEAAGCRFKLAKASSLRKLYPTQNIAFDLFGIAGGAPWEPAVAQPAFCSIDAGHDAERRQSRWVKVESDARLHIVEARAFPTPLAEHVPNDLLGSLWPTQAGAIACRDGRLAQERSAMESRGAQEGRPMIEAKKSPKAILWRVRGDEVFPAEFGDAVVDEHGEILLQTVAQNVQDTIHPMRLSAGTARPEDLAAVFLHQHAMPGLSLFHMSRLPGTLYFADLISKLTTDGWPKAIGRGFKLPSIVP